MFSQFTHKLHEKINRLTFVIISLHVIHFYEKDENNNHTKYCVFTVRKFIN